MCFIFTNVDLSYRIIRENYSIYLSITFKTWHIWQCKAKERTNRNTQNYMRKWAKVGTFKKQSFPCSFLVSCQGNWGGAGMKLCFALITTYVISIEITFTNKLEWMKWAVSQKGVCKSIITLPWGNSLFSHSLRNSYWTPAMCQVPLSGWRNNSK